MSFTTNRHSRYVSSLPKMYVIRPQFFIPMITLLRNAMKSLDIKREIALIREQNLDITNFEDELDKFKTAF